MELNSEKKTFAYIHAEAAIKYGEVPLVELPKSSADQIALGRWSLSSQANFGEDSEYLTDAEVYEDQHRLRLDSSGAGQERD